MAVPIGGGVPPPPPAPLPPPNYNQMIDDIVHSYPDPAAAAAQADAAAGAGGASSPVKVIGTQTIESFLANQGAFKSRESLAQISDMSYQIERSDEGYIQIREQNGYFGFHVTWTIEKKDGTKQKVMTFLNTKTSAKADDIECKERALTRANVLCGMTQAMVKKGTEEGKSRELLYLNTIAEKGTPELPIRSGKMDVVITLKPGVEIVPDSYKTTDGRPIVTAASSMAIMREARQSDCIKRDATVVEGEHPNLTNAIKKLEDGVEQDDISKMDGALGEIAFAIGLERDQLSQEYRDLFTFFQGAKALPMNTVSEKDCLHNAGYAERIRARVLLKIEADAVKDDVEGPNGLASKDVEQLTKGEKEKLATYNKYYGNRRDWPSDQKLLGDYQAIAKLDAEKGQRLIEISARLEELEKKLQTHQEAALQALMGKDELGREKYLPPQARQKKALLEELEGLTKGLNAFNEKKDRLGNKPKSLSLPSELADPEFRQSLLRMPFDEREAAIGKIKQDYNRYLQGKGRKNPEKYPEAVHDVFRFLDRLQSDKAWPSGYEPKDVRDLIASRDDLKEFKKVSVMIADAKQEGFEREFIKERISARVRSANEVGDRPFTEMESGIKNLAMVDRFAKTDPGTLHPIGRDGIAKLEKILKYANKGSFKEATVIKDFKAWVKSYGDQYLDQSKQSDKIKDAFEQLGGFRDPSSVNQDKAVLLIQEMDSTRVDGILNTIANRLAENAGKGPDFYPELLGAIINNNAPAAGRSFAAGFEELMPVEEDSDDYFIEGKE